MDQNEAIWAILLGAVMIGASFLSNNFYASKGVFLSDRKIPTWMGRGIFWMVGGLMILVGVVSFFPNR